MTETTTNPEHAALPEGHEAPPRGVRVLAAVRWLLVALAALAAVYTFAQHQGLLRASGAAKHAQAVLYHCPMHPTVIQDAPGTCPICNMSLVPIAGGADEHAHAAAALESAKAPATALQTSKVVAAALTPTITGFARVALDERGLTSVHTRVAGFVQTLRIAETGRLVERGEILATLYSPELVAAQRELLAAQRWEHPSAGNHDGTIALDARRRLESLGIASQDIDAMLARATPDQALPFRSPARGVITLKNISLGAYVEPNMTLYELSDPNRVWVVAEIGERDAAHVALGSKVVVELAGEPRRALKGEVDLLYPSLDATRRTREVRVKLAPHTETLAPGITGRIVIEAEARTTLTIVATAIVDTGKGPVVFVPDATGHAMPRNIETGARSDGMVEVLSGLKAGDEVVSVASFLLDADSQLRHGIEAMRDERNLEVGDDHAHP